MRTANVFIKNIKAGILQEKEGSYIFQYDINYTGAPVSLTMPVSVGTFTYTQFPPFFEGLLPEGVQLEALLRRHKLDKNDYFGQLLQVGNDLVGAVTVRS